MANLYPIFLWIICIASRGMCKDSQSDTQNDESSAQITSNYFPYLNMLNFDDLPVQSDGSGLDDHNFHKFIGKFYLMPEDETNIFENPFETEHQVEDTHFRSQVSYVPDDTDSNDITEEPASTESSGEDADSRSTQQKPVDSVSVASDGTKIIQRTPTTATPTNPTIAPKTKPPSTVLYGIKYPKPNTTEVKYTLDGTRITQFNTGIKVDNGTKDPSWKFIPDEFVPGYSDSDEQPNAAGYKYRDRQGEEQKGNLIKEQLKEAVKEKNPNYQIHKDKENEMVSSLEKASGSSNGSNSRSFQHGYQSSINESVHDNTKQMNPKVLQTSVPENTEVTNKQQQTKKYSNHRNEVVNSIFYNVKPILSHSHARHLKRTHQKFGVRSKGTWWSQDVEKKKGSAKHKITTKKHYNLLGAKKRNEEINKSQAKKPKIYKVKKMPQEDKTKEAKKTPTNSELGLQTALRSLSFKNEAGVVKKKQNFAYISQCGLYTEPQNVSMVQHAWVTKTYAPYFYLYEKPKNYEQCKPSPWMNGTDMRGNVFISFEVKSIHGSNMENNAKICQKYCCKEPRCSAWVMRKQDTVTANCPKDSFCCWLKSAVPVREPNENAVSGVVQRERYRHPPTGMRSAVPLGGLGTGSFELRADGTFHEWTVENQSPGGAAKLSKTALDLMIFSVRIQKGNHHKATTLRTHAPHGFEGVEKMSYYGTYPVSKIDVEIAEFKDIKMSLYAYSSFKPRDPKASAVPSVAFSLDIENPTNEDADVSFMFNLPLGYNDDTIRRGGNYAEVAFTRLVTAADCMKACAKQSKCMSWTTNGPFSCLLKDSMPLNSYEFGIISGVKGRWSSTNTTLTCARPGIFTQSGQISLRVIGNSEDKISFRTTNDPEKLWKDFKKNGTLGTGKVNETALHGSAAIQAHIPAGKSRLLTIIMSWYLPNRDISDERVGNYYSNLFKSANDVSDYMASHLTENVFGIVNWQSSIIPPKSIFPYIKNPKEQKTCDTNVSGINVLPECLQDILMNSLSFWRSGMWMENGRWRQWEAFDCVNMDPVHVDFHRFLPYVIFFPELAKNVMLSWADHQLVNGMIEESLSRGCLDEASREGKAGGRPMADVNVAFVVQTYLIYTWTNDTEFFDKLYPAAMRALSWLIKDSTLGTDLPYRKPDTYDLFELDKYDHCAYNSILMKLALRAGEEMALLKQDIEKIEEIGKAFDRAHIRLEVEMWDDKDGFYHAWFDAEWGSPSWIMADTLYGQVWAYTLGLGDIVDKDKLRSHLLKERERNDTPFGLKVISKSESNEITQEDTSIILGEEPGCKSLENITKYSSVWMSSSTDWSTLELHLGMSPRIAMHQAEKSLDHYRSTLKDQWNFHGLTSSEHYGLDGLPWASSHYTFHLVLWHLPLALSGQQYYAPNGSLTFNPKYEVPYWLPFYTPVAMGNIEAKYTDENKKEVIYKLTVTSGDIRLLHLSISDSKYGSGEVRLNEGQSASWSAPAKTKNTDVRDFLAQMKR